MFLIVFSKFIPVILLFGLGSFLRFKGYVKETTFLEVKKLIVNLFLPSLLFLSFSNTSFEIKHFVIVVIMFILCILLLFIGRIFQKVYKVNSKYYFLLYTGFEAGMLGYSLFAIFYGVENIAKFAIVDLGQVIFVFFVMVGILNSFREGQTSWNFKRLLIGFLRTPVIIAIFSGIILKSTGLIDIFNRNIILLSFLDTLRMLSQMTVPFILLVIGYELRFSKESISLSVKTIISRILVILIFGFLIDKIIFINFLNLDHIFQKAIITMLILPPPFIIPLYMRDEDKSDKVFISNTLAMSTIFSMLLFFFVNLL